MPRVKLHDGLRVNSEELCLDVGLARGDDGGGEGAPGGEQRIEGREV
jgi:hypothetical protein